LENHPEKNYVCVEAGSFFSLIIKSNRNEFCASGINNTGQLGNWNTQNQFAFVCSKECNFPPIPNTLINNNIICKGSKINLLASGYGSLRWYSDSLTDTIISFGNNLITPNLNNNTLFMLEIVLAI
jgi:hypothetical protein